MTSPGFTHLHVHTQYSLLDGAIRLDDLLPAVKAKGMNAVAVTDHGNMYGAVHFFKTAQKHGVKPIFGCEAYVAGPRGRADRTDRTASHLVLLARDNEGYKNLTYLVSMGFLEGFYYHPRIDTELLRAHSKGLFGLSACLGGVVSKAYWRGGMDAAVATAREYAGIFEPGHFFLELQDNGYSKQPELNERLLEIGRTYDIPLVATADAHFLTPQDAPAHEVLMCIQQNRSLAEFRKGREHSDQTYVKTPDDMWASFGKTCPDAVENAVRIGEQCNVELSLGKTFLPNYGVPAGRTLESFLEETTRRGLDERIAEAHYPVDRPAYLRRLEYELGVIQKMGFAGYFLIVWDFIRYAKQHGIPVGPGRGSGAGSLVAFALRITNLDPLPNDLIFERFLNPERVSMPDFDVDFCQDRRGEVIDYVSHKYGEKNVGQIVTYAQLSAKSVIKDVGRVMDLPFAEVNELTKLIPNGLVEGKKVTIDKALEIEPKLREIQQQKPVYEEVIRIARALEGLNRQTGMHAAGVVIGDKPLWEYVPVCRGKDGELVTQFAKEEVELAGLVKFDFLGLKTLTVIANAVRHVRRRKGVGPLGPHEELDLEKLPLDDPRVYALIASGDTDGVFQLESSGFKELLKRLKPDRFEHIVAANALYRPGPLDAGMVDDYVARKNGKKKVTYPHPCLEEILAPTYGVIVYQEQVMRIAVALSGFTMGEADTLRKAMGKKKADVMAKMRDKFVTGAETRSGMPRAAADELFTQIEKFAGYAFNKCVVGTTGIVDALSGERTTVEELHRSRRPFWVHALGDDWKLRPRRVTDVVSNGVRPVFELRTAQGKRIVATSTHPFRTLDGWTTLGSLRVGDLIATPRRLAVASGAQWPRHELVTLAGLLAEGSDVFWDEVVAIEPQGEQPTFDLTVEEDHSFVADGIVVHNSHSAAYGVVSYQTAFLKTYYPVEFMAALLSTEMGVQENVVKYIQSARERRIAVLPPDVNRSERDFSVVELASDEKASTGGEGGHGGEGDHRGEGGEAATRQAILFGLGAVKGVGDAAIEGVIEARREQPFTSIYGFCERVDHKKTNRKVLEALVKSGAMDGLGRPRWQLYGAIDKALEAGQAAHRDRESGQASLFAMFAGGGTSGKVDSTVVEVYPGGGEWSDKQLLAFEKEALGFYITGHPLDRFAEDLPRLATTTTAGLMAVAESKAGRFAEITLAGTVAALRERPLKDGSGRMAFVTLEDLHGTCEVLVFSKVFSECEAALKSGEPVLVRGTVQLENGARGQGGNGAASDDEDDTPPTAKLRAAGVELLTEARAKKARRLEVSVPVYAVTSDRLVQLKEILVTHRGEVPARLTITDPEMFETVIALPETLRVNPTDELLVRVDRLFGQKVVKLS